MERLVSSWCNDGALAQSYICPPETRPGKLTIPSDDNIPVVNHGVSEKLLNDTMKVVAEFFEMPMEDKASLYSEDPNKVCRLYTSKTNYGTGKYHFWRDVLKHPCHQLEACTKLWPQKLSWSGNNRKHKRMEEENKFLIQ
ncbi:hypothetical protein V6N13_068540 [Hibiscus sabdariffa]|uniref:Non-haem dioxygenase N-terminal domain-containing protein n=1 Tax=Hibiscus sabdariffa TaxID=183260 RepID=A0ABR2QN86_9ROSI